MTVIHHRNSDVCLEAEVSPRGSKSAALPRLDVLMPRLGLNVVTSKLRYDISS